MNPTGSAGTARGWYYYGWNIVAFCMLSQVAANSLTYNAFSLFLGDWSKDLHVPISQLVPCIAVLIFVASPLSPVFGAMADKYPARRLFGIGLFGMGMFSVAVSFAQQGWQIVTLYGVLGAPSLTLCTAVTSNSLISRWFVKRIGLALGLSAFGIGMGGVLLPPVVAWLMPEFGWRMIWRGGGLIIAFVVMPLVVLMLRNRPTEREGFQYMVADGEAPRVHAHAHGAGGGESLLGWKDVLSRRNFWLLVCIYLPVMGVGGGITQNLGPYSAHHGFNPEAAGFLLSILSAAHLVATLAMGLLVDRFGTRVPLAGLALVVAAGCAIMAVSSAWPAIAVGAALVGLSSGVFTPLAAAIAAEFGPQGFGRAFGLAMLFLPASAPLGFIVAKSKELSGSYTPILFILIVPLIIAAILAMLLRAPRGHAGKEAVLAPAE